MALAQYRGNVATRIHGVLARDVSIAVVFRRGPTKQVQQLRWDLCSNEVTAGQWLAGRVYEERCALSPNGELLVYFAMRKGRVWTAVSRPPYFTPLAVWEESGTWGGGGVFESDRRLLLRTNPSGLMLDPKFELPKGFAVEALQAEHRGLVEAGWTYRDVGAESPNTPSGRPRPAKRFAPPVGERPRPGDPSLVLESHPIEVSDPYGPFTASEFVVRDLKKQRVALLGPLDWADWERGGDLLIARDGELLRASVIERALTELEVVQRLSEERFTAMPPPD